MKSSLVTGSTEYRKRVFIQCVSKGVLKLKHSVVRQWLILTIIITFFKYTIFSMQWIWSEWPMPTFSQIKIRNHVHWKSVFWTMLLNYLLQNNPSVKSSPSMIACRWKLRCENWEIWCFSNRRNGFHIQRYRMYCDQIKTQNQINWKIIFWLGNRPLLDKGQAIQKKYAI